MGLLLANETKQLQIMSSVILIMVVLLIVITFCLLFFVYYKYYSKCIDNNLEDETIKNELIESNKQYFADAEQTINNKYLKPNEKTKQIVPIADFLKDKNQRKKRARAFSTILKSVLYIAFISFFAFALVIKFQGNLFYVENKAGLVILTSSMQSVYEDNTYIRTNNLTNQIATNTFIIIEKVQDEDDIQLFDVVAFKDNENRTIVHRVVGINTVDGHKEFTFRGDANNGSADFEKGVTFNRIVGKWTGEKNFVVGVLITYLSSSFGILTICFAVATISLYGCFEQKISKKMNMRKDEIIEDLDKQIKNAIKNSTQLYFVNVEGKSLVIRADAQKAKESVSAQEDSAKVKPFKEDDSDTNPALKTQTETGTESAEDTAKASSKKSENTEAQ